MAAALAGGPEAVLSHVTAAQLWRISPRSRRISEITRATYFRPQPGIRGHRGLVPDDEQTVVDGIPVTTVPRAVLDFASQTSPRQVERALSEMEVRGLTDPLSIPDLLERYPGRRGSAILRALLAAGAETTGVTQNDFEELFVALVDSHGLPRPRFNADISVGGRFCCVDCLWAKERLIVELDGRAVHGTRKAFEDDRERDRQLIAGGWRVMRVTWRQLQNQADAVASDLRKTLSHGRALH